MTGETGNNDSKNLAVKLTVKMENSHVCSLNLEACGNMVPLCFHQVLKISTEPNLRPMQGIIICRWLNLFRVDLCGPFKKEHAFTRS